MVDLKMLRDRARYVVLHPVRAWESIREENRTVKTVHKSFLIPVLILISLSAFAGSIIYKPTGLSVLFPLIRALKQFLCFYMTVLLSSWTLNEISVAFVPKKDYALSFKLVVYSLTPLYLTVIITRFFPELELINLLSLYGAYILYVGLSSIENISRRGLLKYFVVALLVLMTFYFTISWVSQSLLEGLYFAFAGSI
ncbi:MAG: Yip1 family protein [Bacteroidales bacterium]|nr:Yip1 family protein [Bacteroidales bacterium]